MDLIVDVEIEGDKEFYGFDCRRRKKRMCIGRAGVAGVGKP